MLLFGYLTAIRLYIRSLRIARLNERSIFTGFPQWEHFISMMPFVGVTLSSTRHPQFGHFFETLTSELCANFIILHVYVYQIIRISEVLLAQQP